jgi:hypothetical protein
MKNEQKILVSIGIGSVMVSDTRELEAWFVYYASFLCDVLGRTVKLLAYEFDIHGFVHCSMTQ